jgi:hypothetical protein
VSQRIIAFVLEFARDRGASIVEAHPVDSSFPSRRFMGFVPVFEAAGFREVGVREAVGVSSSRRPNTSSTLIRGNWIGISLVSVFSPRYC